MGLTRIGVLLSAVLVLPAAAQAQSDTARAAARDLGAEGVEAFQSGNYQIASDKLARAFEILRAPSLGLWSARALLKTGKLVEASERYLAVTRLDASSGDVAIQKQAQADAASERGALQLRIPSLTVEVKGASGDLAVWLDGSPMPSALLGVRQPANPGKHAAQAKQGQRVVRAEVTLVEGNRESLLLDFTAAVAPQAAAVAPPGEAAPAPNTAPPATESAPAPSDASAPTRSGARPVPVGVWVGLGVAAAGLATGGVTAGIAAGKKSSLDCPNDSCKPSQRADVDGYNRLLTFSTIGFVAAGVGLATAGVFWFTRPRPDPAAAYATPWLGLGSAGVRGAF